MKSCFSRIRCCKKKENDNIKIFPQVYVLKLENNKYYVGKSNDKEKRIKRHINGNGCTWTKKYNPISELKPLTQPQLSFWELWETLELMKQNLKCKSSYWLYTLRVKNKYEFIQGMKSKNIMVSQVHNRNDVNSCVKDYVSDLPNLDILEKDMVCIPVGWWVTSKDREYIVNCIREFYS